MPSISSVILLIQASKHFNLSYLNCTFSAHTEHRTAYLPMESISSMNTMHGAVKGKRRGTRVGFIG